MNPDRHETAIDELKTLTTPPDILHLDIGLNGQLHTYRLMKPRTQPKPKKPRPTPKNSNAKKPDLKIVPTKDPAE